MVNLTLLADSRPVGVGVDKARNTWRVHPIRRGWVAGIFHLWRRSHRRLGMDLSKYVLSSMILIEIQVLTKCFYELSQRLELIEDLRSEVKQAIRDHGGVCRESIEAMTKLDSFIKETMRLQPVGPGKLLCVLSSCRQS
jgi:hypothetical protein